MRPPLPSPLWMLAGILLLSACDGVDPTENSAPYPASLLKVETGPANAKAGAAGDYAATVVSATQGRAVPSGTIAANRSIPENALGAPDAAFFSLGFDNSTTAVEEGAVVLAFGAGQRFKGLTLTVFEESYNGRNAPLEKADVFVSEQANGPWAYVGTARNDGSTEDTRSSTSALEGACVRYVRIVNRTDPGQYSSRRVGDGFDVNAVEIESDGVCQDAFPVDGTVFEDADDDGVQDVTESGLTDVKVRLVSGSTVVETTTTADGSYSAMVPSGTYTVSIPAAAPGLFNALLYDTHTYPGGGVAQRTVTVGPPAADVDFGFTLDVDAAIAALKSGAIATEAHDDKFWTRQARHACLGSHARVDVSANTLAGYLTDIEGLLLTVPFQFSDGTSFCEARDFLAPPAKGEVADFLRELLTAELNVVSGNGSSSPGFDRALLALAESVAAEQIYGIVGTSSGKSSAAAASLSETRELLAAFNSSGGGGGVGGAR